MCFNLYLFYVIQRFWMQCSANLASLWWCTTTWLQKPCGMKYNSWGPGILWLMMPWWAVSHTFRAVTSVTTAYIYFFYSLKESVDILEITFLLDEKMDTTLMSWECYWSLRYYFIILLFILYYFIVNIIIISCFNSSYIVLIWDIEIHI